jgi:hypothetical protein
MRQDDYNENELKRMEDELRSFGTPYSSNEPDDRYWANFRVRLNQAIDAKEASRRRSVFTTVAEWFTASPLRGIALGTATVAVVIVSVMMFNSNKQPVVATNTTVVPAPSNPVTPQVIAPVTGPTATNSIPKAPEKHLPSFAKAEPKTSVKKISSEQEIADAAGDPSKYDKTLSPGTADEPVDYSTLSEAELQSVLADISTISH